MTTIDLINDLRIRVNPLYSETPGTESYERRICAELEADARSKHTAIYQLGLREGRAEVKNALCELIGAVRYE